MTLTMMSQQSNPFRGERSDEKRASASDGLGKREKEREEVKLESPPMSSVTSAGSDACDGKKKTSALAEKKDFIHVRARRGQATDSHSLAERVRREKISQRMKVLQDLVPGCSKISGKASMLDEIINYVQSLQRQVEFLSMKLAAVSPTVHFGNGDALFTKQIVPISGIEASPHLTAMALSSAAPLSESWPFLEMNPPAYPWEADLHAICGAELQPNREGLLLPPAFLGTVELSEISPDCHQRLRERKPLN